MHVVILAAQIMLYRTNATALRGMLFLICPRVRGRARGRDISPALSLFVTRARAGRRTVDPTQADWVHSPRYSSHIVVSQHRRDDDRVGPPRRHGSFGQGCFCFIFSSLYVGALLILTLARL